MRAVLASIILIAGCDGASAGSAEPADAAGEAAGTSFGQPAGSVDPRFGARAPRTCANTKAPARGAITAELARKYFICNAEYVSGTNLYLVENVKLEIGRGTPYTPNKGSFHEINVRVPLYPIRGSLVSYSCRDRIREYSGPPNESCLVYDQTNATGYCYKTTFDDWKCYMSDQRAIAGDSRKGAPPTS
jgi:hypothetical protein